MLYFIENHAPNKQTLLVDLSRVSFYNFMGEMKRFGEYSVENSTTSIQQDLRNMFPNQLSGDDSLLPDI